MLLEALFSSLQPDEGVLFTALVYGATPADSKVLHREVTASPARFGALVAQYREHANIFFGAAPRLRTDVDKVTRVTWLWVDVDSKQFGGDTEAREALRQYAAPPTFVVYSGHGYHAYWQLMDPADPAQAESLMRAIAQQVGGDHTHDCTRLLRVPGTINYKDKSALVDCVLAESFPGLSWGFKDLRALLGLEARAIHRLVTGDARGFKSRSERDWRAVRDLLAAGVTDGGIFTLFEQLPVGDKLREANGEAYLTHTVVRARQFTSSTPLGLIEHEDCYWVPTKEGKKIISSFVLRPTRLLKVVDGGEDYIETTVRASSFVWPGVSFAKSAFDSSHALLKKLPVASWQWMGSDVEARKLLPFLMDELMNRGLPHTNGTVSVGRYGDMWVAPGGTFDKSRVYSSDEAPYVFVKEATLAEGENSLLSVEYPFPPESEYITLAKRIGALLPGVNLPSVVVPMLGWFCATPLKPLFEQVGVRFPHLDLFGTRGSGKSSSVLQIFQPMLGWSKPRDYSCKTTLFALLSLWSQSNAVPICFTEFRYEQGSTRLNDFIKVLCIAYDVGYDVRGRADQTTKVYPLKAPICLDGEDALQDHAARERSIVLNLNPETIKEGTECHKVFREISKLPLIGFAGRYIQRTLIESPKSVEARFHKATEELFDAIPHPIPDRLRRNMAVVLVGLQLYNEHMAAFGVAPIHWTPETFRPMLEELLVTFDSWRTRALVDDFVEDLVTYVDSDQWNSHQGFFIQYDELSNIIWFHLPGAVGWWAAKRRREGRLLLELSALRAQLRERSGGPEAFVYDQRERRTPSGLTRSCYGINLGKCRDGGLDVPSKLRAGKDIVIHLTQAERG